MKSLIFVSILFLNVLTAYSATEPVIKIYMIDGSSKQYFIKDIADLSFFRTNLSYSMSVYQSKVNSKSDFDIRTIDSIEFENNQTMKIVQSGDTKSFNISDIDSIIFTFNTCTEIQIGNQIWMCKNLDVDHYRNGNSIPEVRDDKEWSKLTTGAWCYYNNDPALGAIYGKLYNYYALDDPRGLAPIGWHIASSEWKTLIVSLGSESHSGAKLKETGTLHWNSTNLGATNETGFTALPGGVRHSKDGKFNYLGKIGQWWMMGATYWDGIDILARYYCMYNSEEIIAYGSTVREAGLSVRCVKDK
jgi:uncharacterized protein (TIGR02145 family)